MKDKQRSTSPMKDKHTPGPWIVAEDQVGDDDGNTIADVTLYNEWNTTEGIVTKEMPWEANARLIAAAPELLEILDALLGFDSVLSYRARRRGYELIKELKARIASDE